MSNPRNKKNQSVAEEVVEAAVEDTPVQDAPAQEAVEEQVSGSVIESTSQVQPTKEQAKATDVKPAVQIQDPVRVPAQDEAILAKMAEGDMLGKTLASILRDYVKVMEPGQIVETTVGARLQSTLWNIIKRVVEADNEIFNPIWKSFLEFVVAHEKGIFSDRYIHRFTGYNTISSEDTVAFCAIINLAKITADPRSRQTALKQVDLGATMDRGFTEQGRNNIIQFYK